MRGMFSMAQDERGPRRGRGSAGGRGGEQVAPPSADGATGWFAGRLPDGWTTVAPQVTVDRDEVVVVVTLAAPQVDGDETAVREAEQRYGRSVAWGAQAGSTRQLFTTQSVPVMTRLRQPERLVLDTLVEAGVARSRSDAVAWCVRAVGENAEEWLGDLREALQAVQRLRGEGPR